MKKVLLMVAVCLTMSACSPKEDTTTPATPPADAGTNAPASTNK